MEKTDWKDATNLLIEIKGRTVLHVALLGASLGVAAWVVAQVLRQVIFVPLFCGDATNSMCVGAAGNAGMMALIIVTIAGLMGLVRLGVYRPLLIAIAAAATLWGVAGWLGGLSWLPALLWTAGLFALTYVVFLWLARIRPFAIALIVAVIIVVLTKWIPTL